MSTPINQLPPGQPISNDPILVQQIIQESMGQQNQQNQYQEKRPNIPIPQQMAYMPKPLPPPYLQKESNIDYMKMVKSLILVAILVFISQMPSLIEYISVYIPQNDLNLIIRALLAGASYVGLDIIF